MHDYYSHVLSLREVNDILLQHFDEAILRAHYEPEIEPINERFQIRDNYIETRSERRVSRAPAGVDGNVRDHGESPRHLRRSRNDDPTGAQPPRPDRRQRSATIRR